jgi:hypothetical protein
MCQIPYYVTANRSPSRGIRSPRLKTRAARTPQMLDSPRQCVAVSVPPGRNVRALHHHAHLVIFHSVDQGVDMPTQ